MNIARVVTGLGIVSLFTACAATRHEEEAAPAASPAKEANEGVTSAPGYAAPPPPPAAPAPQGLSEPKSAEAAQDRDEEFTTLDAAERALNQAKSDLDRLALAEPAPSPSRSADRAEKKDSKRAPSAAGAAAPATAGPNAQCDNACRAFASLTRAASAVCRLDGDGGAHCTHAKRVVSDSERRVSSCTCPAPGQ